MAKIPGTNVASPIAPFTSDDQFPTHDAIYGKGGQREVATIAERDAIPSARLTEGCTCYVAATEKTYRWKSNAWVDDTPEIASDASDISYTPSGSSTQTTVAGALDSLNESVSGLESSVEDNAGDIADLQEGAVAVDVDTTTKVFAIKNINNVTVGSITLGTNATNGAAKLTFVAGSDSFVASLPNLAYDSSNQMLKMVKADGTQTNLIKLSNLQIKGVGSTLPCWDTTATPDPVSREAKVATGAPHWAIGDLFLLENSSTTPSTFNLCVCTNVVDDGTYYNYSWENIGSINTPSLDASLIDYDDTNTQFGDSTNNVQKAIEKLRTTDGIKVAGENKTLTEYVNDCFIPSVNYLGSIAGYDLIPSSGVGWSLGVINSTTGAILSDNRRCYTSVPIEGKMRKISIRFNSEDLYINGVYEYKSNEISSSNYVKVDVVNDGTLPQTFELTTANYVVICVAFKTDAYITNVAALVNNVIIEQSTVKVNLKGVNELQGAGEVEALNIGSWAVGKLDSNGANTASSLHLRSNWIPKTGIIELYAGDSLYIESVFIYNGTTMVSTVVYGQSLERCRYTVGSGLRSRVVIKRKDGGAITTDMGNLLSASVVQHNSRIFNVEEKAADVDVRLADVESKFAGSEPGEETAIPLKSGGAWINNPSPGHLEANEMYSYSDPYPVKPGDTIKVTVSCGSGAYGVWGSPINQYDIRSGQILVGNGTSPFIDEEVTIPQGVNYIFISSRNENFTTPFTPSATHTPMGNSWFDDKIEEVVRNSAATNPFKGLKLVTLGDSITQGQVMDGTAPEKPFPALVAEELGMELVNYGIGGSTIGTCTNYGGTFASLADFNAATKDTSKYYVVMTSNQTYADYRYNGSSWVTTTIAMRTPLVDRYDLMDADADIILVAGGTNDFQYNWAPIGEVSDTVKTTFRGALNNLCEGLITKYPQKCIVFMTPIKRCQTQQAAAANSDTTEHRGDEDGHPTIDSKNFNGNGITLKEYGDIIKEMCIRYSIPVIDMYAECTLNPQLSAQSSLFDSFKTHPYQAGHNLMARLIVGKLKSIFGMNTSV